MKPAPRIAVVVPVYNAAGFVRACVEAVLAQEFPAEDYEAVFVDNGSTDQSLAILRSYEPLIVVESESRRGPSAARNRGATIATAPLLAFTDADCMPRPRWLAELVDAVAANPEATMVGGPIVAKEPCTPAARFAERLFDQERAIGAARLPYVISANLCVRRAHLVQAGMFDESLMTAEDIDLSYRMKAAVPGPFLFAERAVVEHANPSSVDALVRKGLEHGRSVGLLADRHYALRGETAIARLLNHKRYVRIASKTAQFSLAGAKALLGGGPPADDWRNPLYDATFEAAKQLGLAGHVLSTALDRASRREEP